MIIILNIIINIIIIIITTIIIIIIIIIFHLLIESYAIDTAIDCGYHHIGSITVIYCGCGW